MDDKVAIVIVICIVISIWLPFIMNAVSKPTGELVIDTSDPEKDRWLIVLKEPTELAAKRHTVKLKVTHRKITEEDKWPFET